MLNDRFRHCECIPKTETIHRDGEAVACVVVHNAYDHRELMEEAETIKRFVEENLL